MIISIAPMLDWTTRHYRYFMRQITKRTILYTEMIVADAIIHGDQEHLLGYAKEEHPVVVQLGGSDPKKLAQAATICTDFGYDGINLNLGCPSDRVKSGNFGACLMREPDIVARALDAMMVVTDIPITVKQRIGLDDIEDYSFVADFVARLIKSGVTEFVIHARNAILKGLSPKENREIPPLKYDYVYQLKRDFPEISFVINGGIKSKDQVKEHLAHVDGVMLGREAYHNPYVFSDFDQEFFCVTTEIPTRLEIAQNMVNYLESVQNTNTPLHHVTRHMLGLYHGCPNAKLWRQTLSEAMIKHNSIEYYINLLKHMEDIPS